MRRFERPFVGSGAELGSATSLIIVGGGLAGSLLARRLAREQPDLSFLLLEKGDTLGGAHTWSFHESDLDPSDLSLVKDLAVGRWTEYTVRFPGLTRRLESAYYSMTSDRLHQQVAPELGARFRPRTGARSLTPTSVTLEDGSVLEAACVIDARGFPERGGVREGYQKFVGLDVELENEHGLVGPVVMDATVIQSDGFRFVYLLPWDTRSLLIEDTYYSGSSALDVEAIKKEISFYAVKKNWKIKTVHRTEVGCLPIPLDVPPLPNTGVPTLGVRGGFFNLTTGYSVPDAVTTSTAIARVTDWKPANVLRALAPLLKTHRSQARFYAALNKMLFLACEPEQRYRVIERFYRLPEGTIQRFYRGTLGWSDIARILVGRPPVPVRRAIASLWGNQEVGI